MKTDYELCTDFCEAEIVTKTSQIATVKDRGTFFAIVLHEIWPEIILYKPWRAAAFDKARESFTSNDKTLYVEFKAWETLASLLGLKPAWVACADRLPETSGEFLTYCDGVQVVAVFRKGKRDWVAVRSTPLPPMAAHDMLNPTHWQPLPAKP